MIPFTVYDAIAGRIEWAGSTSAGNNLDGWRAQGKSVLLGIEADGGVNMVVDGAVAPRPTLAVSNVTLIADGSEQAVAPPLPAGTMVFRGSELLGEADGSDTPVIMRPTAVDSFILRLEPPFPFVPAMVSVSIIAPGN